MTRSNSGTQPLRSLWGPIAWASAGILLPIGLSYPSHFDPGQEPRKAAWEYLSDHYRLAFMLLPIALLALIVGLLALHDYLTTILDSKQNSFQDGTALSIIGLALLLPGVVVRGFALPEYAQTYVLVPQEALGDFRLERFGGFGTLFSMIGFLSLVGGLRKLPLHNREAPLVPRWTDIAFSLGLIYGILLSTIGESMLGYGQLPQLARLAAGLLTAAGAIRIAWALGVEKAPAPLQKDAA